MENKSRSVNYFEIVSIPSLFVMENVIVGEGLKNNYNNNPGRGGTGGSANIKSCKDHDGAQGDRTH